MAAVIGITRLEDSLIFMGNLPGIAVLFGFRNESQFLVQPAAEEWLYPCASPSSLPAGACNGAGGPSFAFFAKGGHSGIHRPSKIKDGHTLPVDLMTGAYGILDLTDKAAGPNESVPRAREGRAAETVTGKPPGPRLAARQSKA